MVWPGFFAVTLSFNFGSKIYRKETFAMLKKLGLLLTALCAFAGNAFAAVDLTGFSVDVTQVEAVVAIVIVGLGTMWGIRKLIKTVNRS